MTRRLLLIAAVILALGALSAGFAIAAGDGSGGDPTTNQQADDGSAKDDEGGKEDGGSGESDDKALTGAAADKASEAALGVTGGGTVLHVEGDDGNTGYEVEVRASDGSVAEVELDANLKAGTPESGDDD